MWSGKYKSKSHPDIILYSFAWQKLKRMKKSSIGEDVNKSDLLYILGGSVIGTDTLENSLALSYKTEYFHVPWPGDSTSGEDLSHICQARCSRIFTATLITITQTYKQPKRLLLIGKTWVSQCSVLAQRPITHQSVELTTARYKKWEWLITRVKNKSPKNYMQYILKTKIKFI